MPYTVPTYEQIRDRYLLTISNLQPDAATGDDSDHYVRACATAACIEELYAHQMWVWRQGFEDLCDEDTLEKKAAQRGVPRKTAKTATGVIRFTGSNGAVIPVGTRVFTVLNSYQTTASAEVAPSGTVDVPAVALVPGVSGNVAVATAATLDASPAGVTGAQILTMTEGSDAESVAALLERYLTILSQPAQGGNRNDYVVWALEVPGVRRAFAFPLRRGLGTVDLVPMPESGLPDGALLAAVQTAIDALKPAGLGEDGFLAIAPVWVVVNVVGSLVLKPGYTSAQVLPLIEAALTRVFDALEPGETLALATLITTIMNVTGVKDVTLTSPLASVTPVVDDTVIEMAKLGIINLVVA